MVNEEVINRIFDVFITRKDTFAAQKIEKEKVIYHRQSNHLTEETIQKHLLGEMTIGVYAYESKTKWLVLDIDTKDRKRVRLIIDSTKKNNLIPYLEDSGNKGYHVWIFFENFVNIKDSKNLAHKILQSTNERINCRQIDILPSHNSNTEFGSLIKLPFGIHQLTQRRCNFLDPSDFAPLEFPGVLDTIQKTSLNSFIKEEKLTGALNQIKPCVQRIIDNGTHQGIRNKWCYIIACECRLLKYPKERVRQLIYEWLSKNTGETEFSKGEADGVINKAYTSKSKYGCKNELLKSLCIGKDKCGYLREFARSNKSNDLTIENQPHSQKTPFNPIMFENMGWQRVVGLPFTSFYRTIMPILEKKKTVTVGEWVFTSYKELMYETGLSKGSIKPLLEKGTKHKLIEVDYGDYKKRIATKIRRIAPIPKIPYGSESELDIQNTDTSSEIDTYKKSGQGH